MIDAFNMALNMQLPIFLHLISFSFKFDYSLQIPVNIDANTGVKAHSNVLNMKPDTNVIEKSDIFGKS